MADGHRVKHAAARPVLPQARARSVGPESRAAVLVLPRRRWLLGSRRLHSHAVLSDPRHLNDVAAGGHAVGGTKCYD